MKMGVYMTQLILFLSLLSIASCVTSPSRLPAGNLEDDKQFVRKHFKDLDQVPGEQEYDLEQLLWDGQYFAANSPEHENLKKLTKERYANDDLTMQFVNRKGGTLLLRNPHDARMIVAGLIQLAKIQKSIALKENKGNWDYELVETKGYSAPKGLIRRNAVSIQTKLIYGSQSESSGLNSLPFLLRREGYVYDSKSGEYLVRDTAGCEVNSRSEKEWLAYSYANRLDGKETCKGESNDHIRSLYLDVQNAGAVCPEVMDKIKAFREKADAHLECATNEHFTKSCVLVRDQMVQKLTEISEAGKKVFANMQPGCEKLTAASYQSMIGPLKNLEIKNSTKPFTCDPALVALLEPARDKVNQYYRCIGMR